MNDIYLIKGKNLEKTQFDSLKEHDIKNSRIWIDISGQDPKDLESVKSLFGIHPLVIEDMSKKLTRPKIESFPKYNFIVIYGLIVEGKVRPIELDFLIGENFVISSHASPVKSYEDLKANPEQIKNLLDKGIDFMLHTLIDREIDNYTPVISSFDSELENLENLAIENPTPELLKKLFEIKRQLLRIRKVAYPEREVISLLAKRDHDFISDKAVAYFRDIYDHVIRVNDQIDNYREIISSILEVHLSVTSNRLNEIMKVLTIITTILMPITAIAGIYGMNFRYMPELEYRYGYFIAVGIMFLISITVLIFIKKKKWI